MQRKGDNGENDKSGNSNRDFKLADGKSLSYVGKDGNSNVYSDIGKSFGSNSYPSGDSSRGGEGGKGGQWGYSGSNSGQTKVNPQVAKQITDNISASESAIQNEIGRLKGLNPIASEETLRSAAIQFLGIATVESQRELEAYKKEQETGLAVNVAQKITPHVLSLNSGEWSLGIHTASSEGRKSKDSTYGLSNQVMICLEHLKIHGGADKLKVLTFTECDLTTNDMIYFGNTMLQYPLLLKYLDFSYNRIGDIGTISFINSFVTSPTGKYPMHHIINLNLSNNGIGDDGTAHIAAYLKHGYMPATTHVNLADNIITDKGALCFAESLNSSVNKLKVLHLEGNKFTKTGEGYLATSVNKAPNDNLGIIMETHKNGLGVWNFIKKAFNYYAKELSQKTQANDNAVLAIYGQDDWAHCKKLITDMSKDMTVGFVKFSSNALVSQALQKSPPQLKGATVGAVFIASAADAALSVDVENLTYCLSAINKKWGGTSIIHHESHEPQLIGNNGEIEDVSW